MGSLNDLDRLKREYSKRETRLQGSAIYSLFDSGYQFFIQNRQREILGLFQRYDLTKDIHVLEVGCGEGEVLLEFLTFGYSPKSLFGLDILQSRLARAQKKLPISTFICSDGQFIPYQSNMFDLVLQFTSFSSILNDMVKTKMATEILRVLKSNGLILWYDFWFNPTNPQTRGIRPAEIRRLFPNCVYDFHKITLAPPIARRIVPVSWVLALLLEKLKVFNSHYLVAIRPR